MELSLIPSASDCYQDLDGLVLSFLKVPLLQVESKRLGCCLHERSKSRKLEVILLAMPQLLLCKILPETY